MCESLELGKACVNFGKNMIRVLLQFPGIGVGCRKNSSLEQNVIARVELNKRLGHVRIIVWIRDGEQHHEPVQHRIPDHPGTNPINYFSA